MDRLGKYRAVAPEIVLVMLCLLLWLVPAGLSELRNADEARYVLIAREWLACSNGLCLTFFGEPYDQKPPLPFLLLGAMLKLTGGEVVTFFVRIPSIALGTAAVIATWRIARRHLGELAGFISALVVMTSMRWMKDVPTTELNIMFSGWITLSLACWFLRPEGVLSPARALAMWGCLAAAFFTKGPFAIVIVGSVLGTEAAFARSWRPFRESRFVLGLLGVVAMIGLWFLAERMHYGADFVRNQVVGESVDRFLQGKHRQPNSYYVGRMFHTIMFPWAIALIPMAFAIWRRSRELPSIITTAFIGWGLIPMIVLSLAAGKREPYPLPLLPGFALVVAYWLRQFIAANRKTPRICDAIMWSSIGWCGVYLVGGFFAFARPDLCEARGAYFRSWQIIPWVGLVVAFAVSAWVIRRNRASPVTPVLGISAILVLTGIMFTTIVKPSADPDKSSRAFSAELDHILESREIQNPVGLIDGAAKPEYHVYGRYLATKLDFESDILRVDKPLPQLLILRPQDWDDAAMFEAALNKRGFTLERTTLAARDEFRIYIRPEAPPGADTP